MLFSELRQGVVKKYSLTYVKMILFILMLSNNIYGYWINSKGSVYNLSAGSNVKTLIIKIMWI